MMRWTWWAGMVLLLVGCSRTALRCEGVLQRINVSPDSTTNAAYGSHMRGAAP